MLPVFQAMAQQLMQSNPLFQRATEMAKGKTKEEILQTAQNLCQTRGIDINSAFEQYKMEMDRMSSGMNRFGG